MFGRFDGKAFHGAAILLGLGRASLAMLVVLSIGVGAYWGVRVATAPAADVPAADATVLPATSPPAASGFLPWLYRVLGLRYVLIFAILAAAVVVLVAINARACRREAAEWLDALENDLDARRYPAAYALVRRQRSRLGRFLTAGMARLAAGYDAAMAAVREAGEEEQRYLELRLSYLRLVGRAGPMFAIVAAIDALAAAACLIARSETAPSASVLLDGITTAVVATLLGLWIAAAAHLAEQALRRRTAASIAEALAAAGERMERFEGVGAKSE